MGPHFEQNAAFARAKQIETIVQHIDKDVVCSHRNDDGDPI